ncbi:ABC transporter permease [Gemella cuniculi]|uniref:ABC transporter permease n=1 Tax=Gemella cuniculi TaxID=150240 RepID=UPI0003FE883A|nr:ABC-2 family transporter protein [Gemella cuniculi]
MNRFFAYTLYQYKNLLQYKFNTMMQIIASLSMVLIQYSIWIYVEKYNSTNIDEIITYVLLAIILQIVLPIKITTNFVSEKILKGNIINYLNRPNGLLVITFFTTLGNFLYRLKFQVLPILVIYILLFYNLIFKIISFERFMLFILVYFLSYIIAFLLGYIVALLSTVFIRINGISELVNALLIIFGGGLLPLDLYPKLLLKISQVTPFYSTMYAPISIIVRDNDYRKILFILGMQIFWLITLWIISKKLSQHVFKKFDIMGG